jgi:hypothetical protein
MGATMADHAKNHPLRRWGTHSVHRLPIRGQGVSVNGAEKIAMSSLFVLIILHSL